METFNIVLLNTRSSKNVHYLGRSLRKLELSQVVSVHFFKKRNIEKCYLIAGKISTMSSIVCTIHVSPV